MDGEQLGGEGLLPSEDGSSVKLRVKGEERGSTRSKEGALGWGEFERVSRWRVSRETWPEDTDSFHRESQINVQFQINGSLLSRPQE